MAYNVYVSALLDLRRELESRIDSEVEDWMRGRADSERLKESILYIIEHNYALDGGYKQDEKIQSMAT